MMMGIISCSSTSNMPNGELLYRGIKAINYNNAETFDNLPENQRDTILQHLQTTKTEIEAALASAPNGAFMGSSSVTTPIPLRLWIYNTYANSEKGFGRWMRDNFGQRWTLLSDVNPDVHTLVAKNILHSYGYFNGDVTYNILPQSNQQKVKLTYDVALNHLSTIDTIMRRGFPYNIDSLLETTKQSWQLSIGSPFSVNSLESARKNITTILRNNGYYYYNQNYVVYTADTVSVPGKILLRISPSKDIPDEANKKWYIGRMRFVMKRSARETITDSTTFRNLTMLYNKERPIRPGVLLRDIAFRRGDVFSYDKYQESYQNIASSGIFSNIDMHFTPRGDTDTLDMTLNLVFDKPYSVTFEAGIKGNNNSRWGPNLSLGLTKNNAFHGGEQLTFSAFVDYQWQLNNKANSGSAVNYYLYGFDVALEYPRLETPFGWFRKKRHRYYSTPKTRFSLTWSEQNRPSYYKYTTLSAAAKYVLQTSETSTHEFSPLTLDFSFVAHKSAEYDSLSLTHANIMKMEDVVVPKMVYTYIYKSPQIYRNPIKWSTTISESGFLTNLGFTIAGEGWNTKGKEILGNPLVQMLKMESDFVKTWQITENSKLLYRINGGIAYGYGNTERSNIPFSESFYVGGANSLRAFTSHNIGPAGLYLRDEYKALQSSLGIGQLKFETNLEYRFKIVGGLGGALFADAGNVWFLNQDYSSYGDFSAQAERMLKIDFFRQLATDVGVGLRYDLGFIIFRLDWAAAIHLPYDTSKTGYFNVDKFSDANALHFAIGYPF